MATISHGARAQLAGRLRLAVSRTARRLRQEAGGGLPLSQTSALSTLDRHGPLSPSALASLERIQRPTATRLLARLEADGLVERTPDPADGRCTRISVSADGRALVRAVRTRKDEYLAKRLRSLDDDDLATLERAATILERMLEEDPA